ncbi:hypothetical protein Xen7305DRAFT_00040410 [Xenococcus sp. PCC 7305]|uniref:hypothetical protein n=1 Tax=Xenococcus sp. PCC 7305 TaxID=102125 RepID=UPI0002AC19D2|nr:hypothetical protein [Xenococcus sp. PCC 7305]ELS04312.1 hypothetical protein Xen7305DRAFT_00040410 [Xenococcus sp. PCC 7305]
MASSIEFKKALREGKLSEALVIAMGNAPELHITTWISSPEDNSAQPSRGKCLKTHVNLVEGKIANAIGENLMGDSLYGAIQKFHSQQVNQGHQAISENLRSLQQMFRLMRLWQQQQNGEEFQQVPSLDPLPKIPPSPIAIEPSPVIAPTVNQASNELDIDPTRGFSSEISQSEAEADDLTDALMSLVDLGIDEEENIQPSDEDNEDWGEWLDDDDSTVEEEILNLESIDVDDAQDWGKETVFIPSKPNNPQDK